MNDSFERMWESNTDYLRRVLLSLAEDVDLTEDLLQDTYLRARAGISGYRGGSEKAWLAAIARNAFFTHARRKGFRSEDSLDVVAEQADQSLRVDSEDYLTLLTLREAMEQLGSDQREALIMRHYGDCSYDEIAEHLSCTPAVAKHRVWRAMQKLRAVIASEEDGAVRCSELRGARILDWLYGALSDRRSAAIESHFTLCAPCRKNLAEIRRLSTILDKDRYNRRICTLIDLDERGRTTRYVWVKRLNEGTEPVRTFAWHRRPGWELDYLAVQGQPVSWEWFDAEHVGPGVMRFEGEAPTPVPPGGIMDAMFIVRPAAASDWDAQQVGAGAWHYHHKHSPFPSHQGVFVVTIRLPQAARLLEAYPEPHKISTRTGRTSMTWRVITRIVGERLLDESGDWQFEADVDYALAPG